MTQVKRTVEQIATIIEEVVQSLVYKIEGLRELDLWTSKRQSILIKNACKQANIDEKLVISIGGWAQIKCKPVLENELQAVIGN